MGTHAATCDRVVLVTEGSGKDQTMKLSRMDMIIMTGKNYLREYKTVFQTCNISIFLSPFLVSKKYLFKVKTGIILVSLRYQSSLGYLYRTLSLPNGPNVFIFKGCCFFTLKMKKFFQGQRF